MFARTVIIYFFILLLSNYIVDSEGVIDDIIQAIKNIIPLTVGGLKFARDVLKFRASEFVGSTPTNKEEYDFIIIGAGSAGCTIANRLTEIKGVRVLLIEAGGHENLFMDIPLAAGYLSLDKTKQWGYTTEPSDDYCLGMDNNQCPIRFGKVVGGTSSLNYMMVTRGNEHNYNNWANMTGDDSWSYDGMLKYFKKLENYQVTLAETIKEAHGHNGPIRVANSPDQTSLVHAFVESGKEFGFPTKVDYNSGRQTGFAYLQTNLINGERMSANRAYLHPIKNRKNLFLSMNSHVNKVLIDPETRTAYGVEFTKANKKIEVLAKKEVIVCAGAIGSPKLLMLSGIGPAEHLRSFNINVLQNAPVGENLMDHITYGGLSFLTVNETGSIVVPELLKPSNPALSSYLINRTGPFSLSGGVEAVAYFNVDDFRPENEEPNVEVSLLSLQFGTDLLFHKTISINTTYFQKVYGNILFRHGYTLLPLLIQPKSRGKVLLRSANPQDNPKIYANYFSDPDDVRVGIKIIRKTIEISKTEAMQKYGSILNDAVIPGCENYERDSDSYWECAFRTFPISLWHHCGTCKMGKSYDPSAVVNSKLQVKGVQNLRVADASVFPMIPTAHTNIPTIALAEKASDLIKFYWGYVDSSTN